MSYCPRCKTEIKEDTKFCPQCGARIDLTEKDYRKGLLNHLKHAVIFSIKNPILFVSETIGAIIMMGFEHTDRFLHYIFPEIAKETAVVTVQYSAAQELDPYFLGYTFGFIIAFLIIALFVMGFSGLLTFVNVNMIQSGYNEQKMELSYSVRYVVSRLGKLFSAAIIGNVFAITIIMFPAVVFMYCVMINEESGIRHGLSQGFKLSLNKLGISFGYLIIYFISRIVTTFIPYVGGLVNAVAVTVLTVTAYDIYYTNLIMNENEVL